MRRLAFFLLILAAAVDAQPTGPELLASWREDWNRAAEGVEAVRVRETLDRTVDGPRGEIEVRTEGTLRYPISGPPSRDVDRAELDGRRVGPAARRRFEDRTERAFGPAGGLLLRPAPLPGPLLAQALADERVRRDDIDGRPAWRTSLDLREGGATALAWFSREDAPRLLRLRIQQDLPRRGRVVFEADYQRERGLDVPDALRTTVTVQQRRRLREYQVSLRARGTYRGAEIVRR